MKINGLAPHGAQHTNGDGRPLRSSQVALYRPSDTKSTRWGSSGPLSAERHWVKLGAVTLSSGRGKVEAFTLSSGPTQTAGAGSWGPIYKENYVMLGKVLVKLRQNCDEIGTNCLLGWIVPNPRWPNQEKYETAGLVLLNTGKYASGMAAPPGGST